MTKQRYNCFFEVYFLKLLNSEIKTKQTHISYHISENYILNDSFDLHSDSLKF